MRPRALVTVPDVAWPLDGGKRLRCAGVVRGLAEVADVDLLVLFSEAPQAGPPLPPDVRVRRWLRLSPPPLPAPAAAGLVVARAVPWKVAAQRWHEVRSRLRGWAHPGGYDLVWFGGLDHAVSLHGAVAAPSTVVDVDDVETEKWRAYLAQPPATTTAAGRLERWQRRVELPLWARVQRQAARRHDALVVCSEDDRRRLRRSSASDVAVVPNTYPDPGPPRPRPAARAAGAPPVFVFVGNFAVAANADAAEQLAREVLPALRTRLPGARVRLVGREAHRVAHLGGAEGLDLVGAVPDVAEELAGADAALVPMRFGGGTRLKLLEAFATGLPVVTSSLGARGLGVVDGVHLLLGETPGQLAEAAARVVTDPALAARLAAAARAEYERQWTPGAATTAVRSLVGPLLARHAPLPTTP